MESKIKTFYYNGENNFGDVATKYILEAVFNKEVEICDKTSPGLKLCITGSIANNYIKDAVHIGTGIANINDTFDNSSIYIGARGHITAQKIYNQTGSLPVVIGDPLIVAPELFKDRLPKSDKNGKTIMLPHYVHDFSELFYNQSMGVYVDITGDFFQILSDISNSSCVVTTSLHGMIAASAYNKPIVFLNNVNSLIGGDGTKYFDFFSLFDYSPNFVCIPYNQSSSYDIGEYIELAISMHKKGGTMIPNQNEFISEYLKVLKNYTDFL